MVDWQNPSDDPAGNPVVGEVQLQLLQGSLPGSPINDAVFSFALSSGANISLAAHHYNCNKTATSTLWDVLQRPTMMIWALGHTNNASSSWTGNIFCPCRRAMRQA
ncbi:hypothetical protein WJX74_009862 [Apatococcus lobatus]|uniref:Uncharacterized protein n=1 Tax=Apatococcus lobatus TaxID=904363 RepID=A0AAW1RNC5_9CHLO